MAESYPNMSKTLWEKEKLLVMSNCSFSPQCFQKACFPWASKGVIVWEKVKTPFYYLKKKCLENIVGKEENAGNNISSFSNNVSTL